MRALCEAEDVGLVVGPSPHDGHHGHEAVGRAARDALEAMADPPALWLWGLWADLPHPTLLAGFGEARLEAARHVLAAHGGELERADYDAPAAGAIRGRGGARRRARVRLRRPAAARALRRAPDGGAARRRAAGGPASPASSTPPTRWRARCRARRWAGGCTRTSFADRLAAEAAEARRAQAAGAARGASRCSRGLMPRTRLKAALRANGLP